MTEIEEKVFADRVLGKLFGFPKCCVDFYVGSTSDALRRTKGFPGIRLCEKCRDKELEEVVTDLNSRRICPQPFPMGPTEKDYQSLAADSRFTTDEQAWLLANKNRVVPPEDPFHQLLLDFHRSMNELNANTEASIAAEPQRENFFQAVRELNGGEMIGVVLNRIHKAMHARVVEQVKAGYLKV